ncbi:MAG: polysaccharide biosynthesis C-terminal domain-containing protein [Planctomycetes bacterium]|nr:polysaccharide biosynthesis C-terminal domain-containing protein [Planctomycetota bacterium]
MFASPPPQAEQQESNPPKGASGLSSVMLLAGRVVSLLLNLAVQVLVVRFFTKLDYGAFAFVLSIVSVSATAMALGMDKTLGRYAAIYLQNRDFPKLFGSICTAFTLISLLGFVCVGGIGVVSIAFGVSPLGDGLNSGLLLVLILLAPLNALDSVVVALFGVFASPLSIVWRRHVIGPSLKLCSVALVIVASGNIYWLAAGHALAVGLGVVLGAVLLVRLLKKEGSIYEAVHTRWEYPTRELLGHSLPLMSTDVVMLLRSSLAIISLELLQGNVAVAEYRAVSPLARLNEVVVTTLAVLFIPAASRMFARKDAAGINSLYWQTASTLAILSFPIFAATFVLAGPLTVLLLGEQYRSSAAILSILALAYYIHTSLGFNTQMLRVYGQVRSIVMTDITAFIFVLFGYILLIPAYGPLGAAIATAGGLVLHNLMNQYWLVRTTDVKFFDARYVTTLTSIVASTLLLVGAQQTLAPHVATSLCMAAIASLIVLYWNRETLDLSSAIPALSRFALFQRLVRPRAARH